MRNDIRRVSVKQFKQAIEQKADLEKLAPVKGIAVEIEKATEGDDNDRVLNFTISNGEVDRDGDTLNPQGWELGNFARGGSMLWGHDPKIVIAKPLATWLEGDRLKSRAQFMPQDMNEFSFMMFRMFREGYVRGVSVGFIPKKWSENAERGGWMPIDFEKQELLEYSGTPIPSNPSALAEAKSKGIDVKPFIGWVEPILDGAETDSGLLISREAAEEMYRGAKGDAPVVVELGETQPPDEKDSRQGVSVVVDEGEPAEEKGALPSASSILDGVDKQIDKACELIAEEASKLAADVKALLAVADRKLSDAAKELLIEVRDSLDEILTEQKQTPQPETTETDDGIELSFEVDDAQDPQSLGLDSKDVAEAVSSIVSEHVESAIRAAQGRVD